MVEISLTDFVDFASKSGTSLMAKVRELKKRPSEYNPVRDYYREIREYIQELHQGNMTKNDFNALLTKIKDKSKIENYKAIYAGYAKFIGRKKFEYFEPPYSKWNKSDLSIRVNPELGLIIDGVPYIVKLYFKSDDLSKQKTQVISHLMETSLRKNSPSGAVMSVLDLRKSKLHSPTAPIDGLDVLLNAQALAFMQLWDGL